MSVQVELLAGRARWEIGHEKPYLALSLYWDAWESLPEGERAEKEPLIPTLVGTYAVTSILDRSRGD